VLTASEGDRTTSARAAHDPEVGEPDGGGRHTGAVWWCRDDDGTSEERGRAEGGVIEIADLFVTRQGQLRRADGFPPHREAFERAGYDVAALLAQGVP